MEQFSGDRGSNGKEEGVGEGQSKARTYEKVIKKDLIPGESNKKH